jgi:hypothetical protein
MGTLERPGPFPVVSMVLVALSKKKVDAPEAEFSAEERILLTSCEFWAAAAARTLPDHLAADPERRLREAQAAFTALGGAAIARALKLAVRCVSDAEPRPWGAEQCRILEERLLAYADQVDALVGKFAFAADWPGSPQED